MYLEEFSLGMTFDIPAVRITKEDILTFSQKYDPLPLHLDEDYAKNTRFGGLIAPGVMSFMAVWAKYMENDPFGDALVAGASTSINWFKPVYADDELTGIVRVTAVTLRNAYNGIVEMTIDAYNQHNELVLSNVTQTVVKRKN